MFKLYNQVNNECVVLIQSNKNAQAAWKLNRSLLELSNEIEARSQSTGATKNGDADIAQKIQQLCAVSFPTVSSQNEMEAGAAGDTMYDQGLAVLSDPVRSDLHERYIPIEVLLTYNLAIALSRLQENERAIDLFNLTLSLLGDDIDEDTHRSIRAASSQRIGNCYLCIQKHSDAIASYEVALDIFKNRSSEEVDNKRAALLVSATLNCIGLCHLYKVDEGSDEAIILFTEALAIRQTVLGGTTDKDSATIMNNLGRAKFDTEDFKTAFEMYKKAFFVRRKVLSRCHPDVLAAIMNAGQASFSMGNLEIAKQFYLEFLRLSSSLYGHDQYSNVITVLKCLAQVYHRCRDPNAALTTLAGALEKARAIYGNSHQEITGVLNDIGSLYYDYGRFDQTIKQLQACLIIDRDLAEYSGNCDNVAITMANLSHVYCKADRFQEALEINYEIIRLHASDMMTIEQSLFIADIWMRIGLINVKLGSLDDTIEAYEHALDIRIDELGDTHSSVTNVLRLMADTHMKQGAYELASVTFHEHQDLIRASTTANKADLSDALCDLGRAQAANEELSEALSTFQEALAIEENLVGSQRFRVPEVLQHIGTTHLNQNNMPIAHRCFVQAMEICRERTLVLSLQKFDVARLLSHVGFTHMSMGSVEEGRKVYAEAIAINRRCGRVDTDNIFSGGNDSVANMISSMSLIPEYAPAA